MLSLYLHFRFFVLPVADHSTLPSYGTLAAPPAALLSCLPFTAIFALLPFTTALLPFTAAPLLLCSAALHPAPCSAALHRSCSLFQPFLLLGPVSCLPPLSTILLTLSSPIL